MFCWFFYSCISLPLFSQKFCTAVRTGDNSFFFSLLFGAMHEKLFALINLMQKKMSQTKIDGLFQGKKKSIIHKLSPSFWPKKYRRTLKDFLTTSYVVIVVLKIAMLLLVFSICWNNPYFVCFRHVSTRAWWNSSLAWDLKSWSEHLHRKHVKVSSHDNLTVRLRRGLTPRSVDSKSEHTTF